VPIQSPQLDFQVINRYIQSDANHNEKPNDDL
jgi:hypothetical protein